jgi:arabinofuranosyltransferase
MLQVSLVVAPAVLLAVMAWHHRWVGDDAFINFRVVKQIQAGHGPVFNAGERVEAGTSPLWIMILFVADVVAPIRLEWIAVLLGIGLTITGLMLAQRGAWHIIQATHPGVLVVPFGALLVAALPPMWDYATSGLETGLGFAWLGACFWGVARRYRGSLLSPSADRAPPPLWLCVLIGLGPLVRPDFAIFSAAFIAAAFVVDPGRRWTERTYALTAMLALPVASEIFRMGFYASLVPNTALTKEGGLSNWAQGWRYLKDYGAPYWLWVPLLVVVVVAVVALLRSADARDARRLAVVGAPVAGALLHAAYVVRVGGDFMHARLLLPATFAALLPASVLVFRGWSRVALTSMVAWAMVCALSLRAPFPTVRITDERRYWQRATHVVHPITVDDFRATRGHEKGEQARSLEASGKRVLALGQVELPLGAHVKQPVVEQAGSVGVTGYLAPTSVYVIDTLGLADPVASRLRIGKRGRPGHEKVLSLAWILARFTDSSGPPGVVQARRALGCGELREVLEATSGPLGFTDIFRNMVWAPRLTSLRFSPDSGLAEQELCGHHSAEGISSHH